MSELIRACQVITGQVCHLIHVKGHVDVDLDGLEPCELGFPSRYYGFSDSARGKGVGPS